jgi:septal ring factor EnvC (AmiA/AmiB activator)
MNQTFKRTNVLLITLAGICLLCTAGLLFFVIQEKNKRIETEQELLLTQKAKESLQRELEQTQFKLLQLKDRAKLLTQQIKQEKSNYQAALKKIADKDVQIQELENSLSQEMQQRESIANTLAQLKENYNRVEQELKKTKLEAKELRENLNKFTAKKTGVELKKIVVRPPKKRSLKGKVLVVNREFDFVVIDLGRKNDVQIGDQFAIYQDSQEVGKVKVEKVYDLFSTASMFPGSQERKIREDSIVKSLP